MNDLKNLIAHADVPDFFQRAASSSGAVNHLLHIGICFGEAAVEIEPGMLPAGGVGILDSASYDGFADLRGS